MKTKQTSRYVWISLFVGVIVLIFLGYTYTQTQQSAPKTKPMNWTFELAGGCRLVDYPNSCSSAREVCVAHVVGINRYLFNSMERLGNETNETPVCVDYRETISEYKLMDCNENLTVTNVSAECRYSTRKYPIGYNITGENEGDIVYERDYFYETGERWEEGYICCIAD